MKTVLTLAALAVALGTAATASELKGPQIVSALSGKSFACEDNKKEDKMALEFPTLDPATKEVPYNFTYNGKKSSGAYVIKSNGKAASKKSGQSRRFKVPADGYVQIIGRSGQYWLCKAQ